MSDRDRHRRASEIFLQACELPPDEQQAFMDQVCGGDVDLRAEVDSLLEHDRQAAAAGATHRLEEVVGRAADELPQEQPAVPGAGVEAMPQIAGPGLVHPGAEGKAPPADARAMPHRIGRYRIVRLIARGGMGEVYEAEQSTPVRRRVALKVIRAGLDSAEVLARFMAERQALALMSHPHIAAIHDAGATAEGRPYVVMEYVDGEPVTEYAERHRLDLGARLDLFLRICEAVSHAHQKGVIHRDLKPSNILVTRADGRAVPKVIDFGIAKATQQPLTERTLQTSLGQLVGTPEYMSPEQAAGTGLDVDTRADVYALGVILYELLAGTNPLPREALKRAGLEEMLRLIREHEPVRPSLRVSTLSRNLPQSSRPEGDTLARKLAGDLDWITLRALEKDRERRYGSAADLAEDIRRYRRHEPVSAGPPSGVYRLRKFVQRNRTGVAFGILLAAVLLASAGAVTWQWRTAVAERERAEAEARKSRQVVRFMEETFAEASLGRSGSDVTVVQALDRILERLDFELAGQPELMASVCDTVGALYRNFSMNEKAEPLLLRALELRQEHLEPDHPDMGSSYVQLAGLRVFQERTPEAESLARQGVEILRRHREGRPEALADGLNTLGLALRNQGNYQEALAVLEEGAAIARAIPDNTLQTREIRSTTFESLAGVRRHLADYEGASSLMEEVVELRRSLSPDSVNSGVATALYNLGAVRQLQGHYREAVEALRETLSMEEVIYGERHPWRAITMNLLARNLLEVGEVEEADGLIRQALDIHKTAGPDYGRRVGEDLLTQSRIDLEMARYEDARNHLDEGWSLAREVLGDEHPLLAKYLGVRADLEAWQENRPEALQLLHQQRVLLLKTLPADHPDIAEAVCRRARLLALQGEPEPAFAECSSAMEALRTRLGAAHPRWARAAMDLAEILVAGGRSGEAAQWAQKALDVWEEHATGKPDLESRARELLGQ